MSLVRALTRAFDVQPRAGTVDVARSVAGTPAQGFLPVLGSVPSATGLAINQGSALTVSTVYACVARRAKDVARCTPGLFRQGDDGKQEQIHDHPLARLFRRPNRLQTWYEFAMQVEACYLLKGNGYVVLLRDHRGTVVEMIPVNPDNVLVLEASDGSIFYQVNRSGLFQMAVLRDQPIAIPEEDVLHLRGITLNMTVGLSTIGMARDDIGLAMGFTQQAARLMSNGARPSGVLKTDKQLSVEAAARLKAQWETLKAGLANSGSTAILEEGLTWTSLALNSVDLQFIEQKKLQVEEVARFFGVPLHKIGVFGSDAKIKLDQADQAYVNDTVMPDCEMWEQRLERVFDLDDEGFSVSLDERNLLRAEEATRINNGRLAVLSGLITINEWRARESLPPMPGGDVLLQPVGLAALGSNVSGTAPDGAGRPEDGDMPDPGSSGAKETR